MLRIIILLCLVRFLYPDQGWVEKHFQDYESFGSPLVINDSSALILGSRSSETLVYKTTDQGRSWDITYYKDHLPDDKGKKDSVWNVSNRSVILDSLNYYFYYSNRIYWPNAETKEATVIDVTNDGGKSFRRVKMNIDSTHRMYFLSMYNKEIGLAGTDFELMITFDGWKTHKVIPKDSNYDYFRTFLSGYYFLDSNNFVMKKNPLEPGFDLIRLDLTKGEWSDYCDDGLNENENNPKFTDLYFVNDSVAYGVGNKKDGNFFNDVFFKSTNKGKTWTVLYEGDVLRYEPLTKIVQDPNDPNHLIAHGFHRWTQSFDAGKTWEEGRSYSGFAQDSPCNLFYIGDVPIIATKAIYRWEEVEEDETLISASFSKNIVCALDNNLLLSDHIEFENELDIINYEISGDFIKWSDIYEVDGYYLLNRTVTPGDHEFYIEVNNSRKHSEGTYIYRDTFYYTRMDEIESPVIENRNDTLFTQFDEVTWAKIGSSKVSVTSKYFIPEEEATYGAWYYDENNCYSFSGLYEFRFSRVNEISNSDISLINRELKLVNPEFLGSSINIYNLSGRNIYQSEYKRILDISQLTTGVYFIKIITRSDKVFFKKILIK